MQEPVAQGSSPVLDIDNVTVSYRGRKQWLDAVRDVSLQIEPGQSYGLVGESGSGKSTLALAVMRCLPPEGRIRTGSIRLAGTDLMDVGDAQMRRIWAEKIKLVPQNPLGSLNPSLRIGEQIMEGLPNSFSREQMWLRTLDLLVQVRLSDPERVADSYPHQLSGGMQQRVMIAMALSGEPDLLVLDEPTTSLDVTTEAAILDLVQELVRQRRTAVLYVSHNLGVISRVCDRVAVLYAGELVEDSAVDELFRQPMHPYSQGLIDSVPRMGTRKHREALRPIQGHLPRLDQLPRGCVFTPRCPLAIDLCAEKRPLLEGPSSERQARCHRWTEIMNGDATAHQQTEFTEETVEEAVAMPVLEVRNLKKHFRTRRTLREILERESGSRLKAVDGVDLELLRGRTLGLVGESGSGKTTVARCIIGLVERSAGDVRLVEMPLDPALSERDRETLRQMQMVFQHPEEALNPYLTVEEALRRPLARLAGIPPREVDQAVIQLLEAVRLSPAHAQRLPAQLSGGEKQRVAIAQAFASHPEVLLFDESVSSLDVSVQASILNLLSHLQAEHNSAYLFISHDLAVVSYLADEIAVIYLGRLMEVGRKRDVLDPPYHPYTEALLSAVPVLGKQNGNGHGNGHERIRLRGEVPSALNPPSGCPFHTRCPRFLGDICVHEEPPWQEGEKGHRIYCHIPLDELRKVQKRPFLQSTENGHV